MELLRRKRKKTDFSSKNGSLFLSLDEQSFDFLPNVSYFFLSESKTFLQSLYFIEIQKKKIQNIEDINRIRRRRYRCRRNTISTRRPFLTG